MAKREMNPASLTPAVGYVRRSTTRQEMSLTDQRTAIEKYAAEHGYCIRRWYEDDGISGDDTDKRAGFQQMHNAATNGADFDAILVWDQSRFGRFDSIEAGLWIHPLRKAGVRLVTVVDGPIDWNDFTGRVIYSLKQEGKHQFLIDLAHNATRGMISTAKEGYLCGQIAPYGYDRMAVDANGDHQLRIRNGEQVGKPKSWKITLVPSDDPQKVEIVKWLFTTYAEQDESLRSLAAQLNRRGVPSPRAGGMLSGRPVAGNWHASTVRTILENEVYAGTLTYAKKAVGKYCHVSAGDVKRRSADGAHRSKTRRNADEEIIRIPNTFEALVDEATWKAVSLRLRARKRRTTPKRTSRPDCYLLSGLVVCGCCGKPMYGTCTSRARNGKRNERFRYVCSTYNQFGNRDRNGVGCYWTSVDQAALLSLLLRKIQESVLVSGNREELERRIRARLETRQHTAPIAVNDVRKQLEKLDREIDRAADRLLKSPDNLVDVLAPKLTAMRNERQRVQEQLNDAKERSQPIDIDAEVKAVADHLWSIEQELDSAKPARLRELMRRMVDRIDLQFDKVPKGKRTSLRLSKGVIRLNSDPMFSRLVRYDTR